MLDFLRLPLQYLLISSTSEIRLSMCIMIIYYFLQNWKYIFLIFVNITERTILFSNKNTVFKSLRNFSQRFTRFSALT